MSTDQKLDKILEVLERIEGLLQEIKEPAPLMPSSLSRGVRG